MGGINVINKITNFFKLDKYFESSDRKLTKINTIVIHWTGGNTLSGAVNTLYKRGVGYHFLIDNDGTIVQGNKITDRARHAGSSYGPNGKDVNSYSIGISLVAKGYDFGDIYVEQINSLINLIENLFENDTLKNNIKWITGHHQVSPKRKDDPYTLPFEFIINKLSKKNINLNYWKMGMSPFPEGLKDCECDKESKINTKNGLSYYTKSIGRCIGQGGYNYKPELVTKDTKQNLDDLNISLNDLNGE